MARVLFDGLRNHGQRVFVKGASDVRRLKHFRFVQRVTKRGASTTGAGVPVEVSCIRRMEQGCPAHP